MNKRTVISLVIVALLFVVVAGMVWYQQQPSRRDIDLEPGERLRVVTTFFPLYDFAREIAGDEIELTMLFTQTPEVASFRPADIQQINEADLVIQNGAGLEPVLDELISSSDNKDVVVITTSRGIALREPSESVLFEADSGDGHEGDHHDDEEHADGHEEHNEAEHEEDAHGHVHEHGDLDPHIWLDPNHASVQVQNIAAALIQADPENAELYDAKAQAYIAELMQLDEEIEQQAAGFRQRDFVAFHPAFKYLAARYGLNQAAVIEESPGQEPTPRYVADVIATIRELNITAIFSEPQFSPRVVDSIARDTGLTVHVLDPIESGQPDTDESYLSRMRENLASLTKALQ